MYKLKQPLEVVSRKKMLLKFENVKENEWYTDDDKNIQKLLQISLLLLFFFFYYSTYKGVVCKFC